MHSTHIYLLVSLSISLYSLVLRVTVLQRTYTNTYLHRGTNVQRRHIRDIGTFALMLLARFTLNFFQIHLIFGFRPVLYFRTSTFVHLPRNHFYCGHFFTTSTLLFILCGDGLFYQILDVYTFTYERCAKKNVCAATCPRNDHQFQPRHGRRRRRQNENTRSISWCVICT